MACNRKDKSGAQKRREKLRREALHKTQVGSLNKYFNSSIVESSVMNEIDIEHAELDNVSNEEDQVMNDKEEISEIVNENKNDDLNQNVNERHNEEINPSENEEDNEIGNEDTQNVGASEKACFPFNIDDPGNWNKTDRNIRELLVEKGPKREVNVIFPKDDFGRCFSSKHYLRDLPNGEKQDRKWLVYSVSLDKIFCFVVNCSQIKIL